MRARHLRLDTHSEYVLLIAFPLQQRIHEHAPMSRYTYTACVFFSLCFCLPLRATRQRNAKSSQQIPHCRSLFPASWVIYKTWQLRQCFDWQESYKTICILSFMVCSVHGDQLCTVVVLLYATSQQHPSPPPWWCRQPTGRQDKLLCGTLVSMRRKGVLTDVILCLYMTLIHTDTNP